MNSDNHLQKIDNRACGHRGIALFARPVGDVLQGAAADCNSATQIDDFTRKIIYLATARPVDKTAGQTANASGTLTTGWWLIPAAILGAALWVRIIGGGL